MNHETEIKSSTVADGMVFRAQQYLIYTKEFMGIVKYLTEKGAAKTDRNYIMVEKPELYRLLCRNAYEVPENKLNIWRGLGWILTDEGRYTKRFRKDGRIVRAVRINTAVYDTLSKIVD